MAVLRGFEGQKGLKPAIWAPFPSKTTPGKPLGNVFSTPILVSLPTGSRKLLRYSFLCQKSPEQRVVASPNPRPQRCPAQRRARRRKLTGKRHAGGGAHPRRCPLRARNRRAARTAGSWRAARVSMRGGGTRWRGRRRSRSRTRPRPSRAQCRLGRPREPCCRCPLRNICPARCRCCTVSRP